nr:helix-turn-helix transcriptional regulator [uncultured Moellerella sp.]
MTGKQLAKLMNISQQQVSRYEIGITSITLDQLEEFLKILNKEWSDVIEYIEKESSIETKTDKNKRSNKYLSWNSYSLKSFNNN